MVLSQRATEVAAQSGHLKLRFKQQQQQNKKETPSELENSVYHILLPRQPLPQENDEVINHAQVSGWSLNSAWRGKTQDNRAKDAIELESSLSFSL